MKNVYVHYVENTTPLLKKFKTVKAAKAFSTKFTKENPDPTEGYWIDYIIVGQVIPIDEYYSDSV